MINCFVSAASLLSESDGAKLFSTSNGHLVSLGLMSGDVYLSTNVSQCLGVVCIYFTVSRAPLFDRSGHHFFNR